MNALTISLRNIVLMTFLLGGIYPMTVLVLGKTFFPIRSSGSVVMSEGKVLGSELIAQKFTRDEYFWPRPSAVDYAAHSGGASQKSGTSKDLKDAYLAREAALGKGAPMDMLYASGSGLDPHISVEAAHFQQARVGAKRNLSDAQMNKFIKHASEERFLGFMGQPRVNVLKLNQILDKK
jgi:K+-transporting ATPase ATPase C chain